METDRKARGAYYTPAPLAEALCRWAIRARTDRVFDPAAGDGAFLRAAAPLLDARPTGVELDPDAARLAGVPCADFFETRPGMFDAVVGNPPFIRFQKFDRGLALIRAREAGVDLSGESSAWAPFVAVAATLVHPGGRLAMVIPREALFVNYARPLWVYLASRFGHVEVVEQDGLMFDALVRVAVLKCGPGSSAHRTDRSWLWSRIPPDCRRAVEEAPSRPLTDVARLRLGIVTGDKNFFVVDGGFARRHLTPVYSSPSELTGPPRKFLLTARRPDDAVRRYIARGEAAGVAARYKCRIRDPWWRIEPGPAPDAFLGYLVHRRPAFRINRDRAQSTNNVHQIFFTGAPVRLDNPLTELSIELLGRIYGGGVLKIEPGDAGRIRIPTGPYDRPRIERALAALRARRLTRVSAAS